MQLTKLEIKGFKSFGDKVVINFDQGITGIVGPNGCGKSNVIDAMRWVLGEQKQKNLRSDKMENVIFNGTKNRKPLQMAEVSLTLANTKNLLPTEYSQVTITRKYYRSGESEYMLNGVLCRLKDITNLFLDTGIGSDSYAIIELKMVDDILNDKNNSRRLLFEEASGISKFKVRKKETIKKIEDTDKDLERVEDLLFEIDKNLKSLERQAKVAKSYFEIKSEYKTHSVDLAKLKIQSQTDLLASVKKQIDEQDAQKSGISALTKELDAQMEKEKVNLIAKEKTLASRQKALNNHVGEIRQIESDKKIKNERHRFLNDKKNSLTEQLENDRKSKERASLSLDAVNHEREVLFQELSSFQKYVEELKLQYETQRAEVGEMRLKSSAQNESFREQRDALFNLKKTIEIKQVQLSTYKQELEKITLDKQEHSQSLSDFQSKTNEIEKDFLTKKEAVETLRSKELLLKENLETLQVTIESTKDEVTKINRTLDAKENEYNLTKSLVDNLEGFPEAIKFLKKNDRWYKDAPLLTDVIGCDEEYRTCIENFLENYLNYYIVDDEEHALQAIELLNDSTKGRAHFFILNKYEASQNSINEIEGCISATDIVLVDEKYRRITSNLLKNVFISTSDRLPIVPENGIIISKSGKIIKKARTVSGGSVGLFEGKKIGRAKNLEKLKKDIRDLSKDLSKKKSFLNDALEKVEQLKSSSQADLLSEMQAELNVLNEQYITLKTKKEQFSAFLENSTDKLSNIQTQIETLDGELSVIVPNIGDKELALSQLEAEKNELEAQLNIKNELLSENTQKYNEQNILLHQKQNKLSNLDQELKFKNDIILGASERIEKNSAELKLIEEDIKKLISADTEDDGTLLAKYKEKEAIEVGLLESEKEFYQLRGLINELEDKLKEVSRKKNLSDEIILELRSKENEIRLNLSSVKERLSIEFEINIDSIIDEPFSTTLTLEELTRKVQNYKDQMEKMGPINPMAMEAYDEIKERHTFILEQKKDLSEAKNSLLETISEIDTVAKDSFEESFGKIRENFKTVFRTLFTSEDDCDLKLAEPDNPLESEILITAKPKGKRPLTINQLSGGEKTLTAISLLFSIYLLKPAPFCIFDEVDAPLDDANIDKFNKIIREFSGESQFIIVTHNKRTMASTDIIYGVTMPEIGVSRVIPVDLRELKLN